MENKDQLNAINHDFGPALVLAGPGSGKTYVLTHHVCYLINSLKIPKEKILVITFTKKAAIEMKERFKSLDSSSLSFFSDSDSVIFATFHSVFFRFLRFYNPKLSIIDPQKRKEIISDIAGFEQEEFYSNEISRYKSVISVDNSFFRSDTEKEDFYKIYNEYEEILKSSNLIDYDDINVYLYNALLKDAAFLSKISSFFSHILIDEFQDINSLQYEIIKMITRPSSHVFAVGDFNQSIYAFRGSSPEIMRQFSKEYENVSLYRLSVNYRSNKDIVYKAFNLINHNPVIFRNELQNCIDNENKDSFSVIFFKTKQEELRFITSKVYELSEEGKSIAILARSNKDADYYFEAFFRKEKEYEEVSFEPVIYIDLYHYLNYILNNDKRSLLNIINRPERNLVGNAYLNVSFEDQIKKHKGTRRGEKEELFYKHINNLKHLNPSGFVLYLENVCGYKEFIISETGKESKEKVYEILDKVNKLAFNCVSVRELFEKIKEHINEFPKKKRKLNLKNLSVMTFHASKGLEFDEVFLPDVNEGKVPGRMIVNSKAIEEERRLFYVAVTRAKEKLFVLAIKNEESEAVLPSRFIDEMDENVLLKENV